ncbi:MAG: hypothetical protein IJW10_04535 [Clostridia bacterium]|nr:hypothetical protein [Clostridia bacterium]
MLNFKRIICLALALMLCLVFIVACDKEDESSSSTSSSSEEPSSSQEPSSSAPDDSSEDEVVTSIREGEGLNSEKPDYTTPVPPNYQPQSSK